MKKKSLLRIIFATIILTLSSLLVKEACNELYFSKVSGSYDKETKVLKIYPESSKKIYRIIAHKDKNGEIKIDDVSYKDDLSYDSTLCSIPWDFPRAFDGILNSDKEEAKGFTKKYMKNYNNKLYIKLKKSFFNERLIFQNP